MPIQLGEKNKLYYDSGLLNGGSSDYSELEDVSNVTVAESKETGEVRSRATSYVGHLPSLRTVSFSFEMIRDTGDTDYQALRGAYDDDEKVVFVVADGAYPPESGDTVARLKMECYITGWERSEPIGEADAVTITCELAADATNDPDYQTETGGA